MQRTYPTISKSEQARLPRNERGPDVIHTAPAESDASYPRSPRRSRITGRETRRDKFKRLAEMRTANAVKAIRLLIPLSRSEYDRRPSDIERIKEALIEEIAAVEKSFETPGIEVIAGIKFDD